MSTHSLSFPVTDLVVDRYGFLKPSAMLFFVQEAAGQHCDRLGVDFDTLAKKNLFWAVIRNRLVISRTPRRGEMLHIETWPMPTTRAAFPRCVAAYDEEGKEVFRSLSLWVLMDLNSRAMVLPGKSGVEVRGILRGSEPETPPSLAPADHSLHISRQVRYSDLDRNGHMNNTRYLDWMDDLQTSSDHRELRPREISLCYYAEALEGQTLQLHWDAPEESAQVDITREKEGKTERVFSARVRYGG